jgi:hypothetical protein
VTAEAIDEHGVRQARLCGRDRVRVDAVALHARRHFVLEVKHRKIVRAAASPERDTLAHVQTVRIRLAQIAWTMNLEVVSPIAQTRALRAGLGDEVERATPVPDLGGASRSR